MDVRIELTSGPSDELIRDLHEWISEESGSLGPVRLRESAPAPGALGPIADAVLAVLGAVGSVSSLAAVVVAWLQYRKPDTGLIIYIGDWHDPVRISGLDVQQDPQAAQSELAGRLAEALSEPPPERSKDSAG